MAVTGFRRWTLLGSVNIESGTSSDLINTGTGGVTLAIENQLFELSSPKVSSAQGNISSLSDEIPQGSKITGIEYIYPLGFSATTFPTSATTRAQLTLSDSNVSSYDVETVTANSPFRLRSVGGDGNLLGLNIDPFDLSSLNFVKFNLSLYDVTGFQSSDFNARSGGANFDDTLSGLSGPFPAVRVFYNATKVVITNLTRVVLHNNKRAVIGHT
jgi:hypothetical protein